MCTLSFLCAFFILNFMKGYMWARCTQVYALKEHYFMNIFIIDKYFSFLYKEKFRLGFIWNNLNPILSTAHARSLEEPRCNLVEARSAKEKWWRRSCYNRLCKEQLTVVKGIDYERREEEKKSVVCRSCNRLCCRKTDRSENGRSHRAECSRSALQYGYGGLLMFLQLSVVNSKVDFVQLGSWDDVHRFVWGFGVQRWAIYAMSVKKYSIYPKLKFILPF